jgi:hypothetical protein
LSFASGQLLACFHHDHFHDLSYLSPLVTTLYVSVEDWQPTDPIPFVDADNAQYVVSQLGSRLRTDLEVLTSGFEGLVRTADPNARDLPETAAKVDMHSRIKTRDKMRSNTKLTSAPATRLSKSTCNTASTSIAKLATSAVKSGTSTVEPSTSVVKRTSSTASTSVVPPTTIVAKSSTKPNTTADPALEDSLPPETTDDDEDYQPSQPLHLARSVVAGPEQNISSLPLDLAASKHQPPVAVAVAERQPPNDDNLSTADMVKRRKRAASAAQLSDQAIRSLPLPKRPTANRRRRLQPALRKVQPAFATVVHWKHHPKASADFKQLRPLAPIGRCVLAPYNSRDNKLYPGVLRTIASHGYTVVFADGTSTKTKFIVHPPLLNVGQKVGDWVVRRAVAGVIQALLHIHVNWGNGVSVPGSSIHQRFSRC